MRILKRIAEACALLRDAGYYHCDIKPDNIGLIDGKAVLIDFGCVRRIARTTRCPARIGTEPFQAPEVADGKISEPSEIYSLGVTTRVLAKKSASLFRLALAIIPAKAKQPRKRFRSFEAFAAAVEHLEAAARHPDFDALGCQHERVYRILAECYRDGKGVAPDPAKSQYYRFKGR